MQAIIDFFAGIGQVLVSLVEFLIKFIGDLIWFVAFLAELAPKVPTLFVWLPAGLATVLGLSITVVVILRVLGRGD